MASNASVATLAIFDWPGAVKNACWGASPNPALWDKMSQRGWLRHRRCRAGSLSRMPKGKSSRPPQNGYSVNKRLAFSFLAIHSS